jgi:hypothetical protein
MEALLVSAGSWASISGVVISTVGLIATIIIAWGARSASRAARAAAIATNNRIENHLQAIDLERAIGLIQRIKLLHDTGWREAALEQYQSLRMMLSGIITRTPEDLTEFREKLATARAIVTTMENSVRISIRPGGDDPDWTLLDESLNDIQSTLEELASAMGFGDLQGEAT